MNRAWIAGGALALIAVVALAQGVPPASAPESVDVLGEVAASGQLARANEDLYANAFVASGIAPDGGTATYSFVSNRDSRMKIGAGTQMELVPNGNRLDFNMGEVRLPTAYVTQPACTPNTNCLWYSDGWFGTIPGSTPACTGGTEGGLKGNSTDKRLYHCDGTASRPLAREIDGGLQLPPYTTATLPDFTPAGRLVYDTDAACVKFSNGFSWGCL